MQKREDLTKRPIAVTFDFWNTLMWERPGDLVAARLEVLEELLARHGLHQERGALEAAHEAAFIEYQAAWKANEQYVVSNAVDKVLVSLGMEVSVPVREALVGAFSEAGRRTRLHLCEGVRDCLQGLRQVGIRTAVICDIGLTPSPVLRWHLDREGLLAAFDALVFSDECGCYKPDSRAFEAALAELRVTEPNRCVHIGDRLRTDVAGALSCGMRAIRYRGVYDDPDIAPVEGEIVADNYQVVLEHLRGAPGAEDDQP